MGRVRSGRGRRGLGRGLLGLALHLRGQTVGDSTAWQVSDEGRSFYTRSSEAWGAEYTGESMARNATGHLGSHGAATLDDQGKPDDSPPQSPHAWMAENLAENRADHSPGVCLADKPARAGRGIRRTAPRIEVTAAERIRGRERGASWRPSNWPTSAGAAPAAPGTVASIIQHGPAFRGSEIVLIDLNPGDLEVVNASGSG